MARRRGGSGRRYPKTARVNELLREIIADELHQLDDERLRLVTVMGVDAQVDLDRATVFWSSVRGPEDDESISDALAASRGRLQAAIAKQAGLRQVPELVFQVDPAVRTGERIEEILRELDADDEEQ